ncbi:MAG: outer membrane protein assembly factor BamE [Bacteroidales bacterium]|jgi:outer membrane protein assembly factor BamE (lipoprotein component of BamABCDE complex)|nr:outer membrane protein assembly factor BamE [Bacteroidales bacterium]
MKKLLSPALFAIIIPFMTACSPTTSVREEQITVAKAQREIKIGMSSAAVVEVLGSPNMVTTDDQRRETWVYDRVSTNVSSSSGGVWLLIGGTGGSSSSKNQRTLTIIVKFDEHDKVRDFAYRTSTF